MAPKKYQFRFLYTWKTGFRRCFFLSAPLLLGWSAVHRARVCDILDGGQTKWINQKTVWPLTKRKRRFFVCFVWHEAWTRSSGRRRGRRNSGRAVWRQMIGGWRDIPCYRLHSLQFPTSEIPQCILQGEAVVTRVTRIKRNSVTKSHRSKTKTVLKSVHFLKIRAMKQPSSQHTHTHKYFFGSIVMKVTKVISQW